MSSINIQTAEGLIEIGGKVTEEKIISALGYTPADKEDLIDNIIEDESGELTIADESGNVIMSVGTGGVHTTEIIANGIEVGKTVSEHISDDSIHVTATEKNAWDAKSDFSGFYQDLQEAPNITEDDSGSLVINDNDGNIVMQVDSNGLETTTVTAKSVVVNGVDVETKLDEHGESINDVNEDLSSHIADSVSHITADERTLWTNKSDFSGDYNDLENAPNITEDESGEVSYADNAGNVIAKINSEGLETTQVIANTVIVNGTAFDGSYDSLSDIPTDLATQSYVDEKVDAKVAAVVGSAPEMLDTLDELAAALGDDANFATTVTNSIAQKASQTDLDSHTSNTTIHITASERTTWNNKSDFSGSYNDLTDTPNILDDESDEFSVTDESGNVIFKVDSNGSHTTSLEAETIILDGEDVGVKIDQHISDADTKITNIVNGTTKVAKAASADSATTATSATSATKATQDGSGNTIASTYETKTDATNKLAEAKTYADTVVAGKANSSHTHTVSNITDLTATATELNYMDGVTSNVQTQLDGKAASSHTHTITASASDDDVVVLTGTNGTNKVTYNASHATSGVTAGTYKSVTVNKYGHVTAGTNPTTLSGYGITDAATKTELNAKQATITGGASTITSSNLTASRALVSDSSGKVAVSDVTSTELGYLDGVTSNIQTQLDDKATSSHTHDDYMTKTNPTGTGSFSLNRKADTTVGSYSFAEGYNNEASGNYSHAEGNNTTASGAYSHAEGVASKATGAGSHAEGSASSASGANSHAEGGSTTASGNCSHAEGSYTKASGLYSHAEGYRTTANSNYQHTQGKHNIEDTNNVYAHIVGNGTSTSTRSNAHTLDWDGNGWFAGNVYVGSTSGTNRDDGSKKLVTEDYIPEYIPVTYDSDNSVYVLGNGHTFETVEALVLAGRAPILYTLNGSSINRLYNFRMRYTNNDGTHPLDFCCPYANYLYYIRLQQDGTVWVSYYIFSNSSHTHDTYMTKADPTGTGSFSLNRKADTTVEIYSFAEGYNNEASGACSHAEGNNTTASGAYSHAEGQYTLAEGAASHAEGYYALASGGCSHAEGSSTTAEVDASHAEGFGTTAGGYGSHAEGGYTTAGGYASHAEGGYTTAEGDYSHAEGNNTTALYGQHAQGHYNNTTNAKAGVGSGTGTGTAFVIGNGTEDSTSNAFRVNYNGQPYCKYAVTTSGCDYAEYFEWKDANINVEDRRGYFVTLDEDKIKIAEPNDYILGIISALPSIIGNGDEDWMGRYVFDDFGDFVYEEFEYETEEIVEVVDEETGNVISKTETVKKTGKKYKENPDYDPSIPYIQRGDRPEWDAVGMLGVLSVRDDGTCQVNGYCKVAEGGIATASDSGYRVIKRVNDNIVKVIFK